jgi:hypothetical protein
MADTMTWPAPGINHPHQTPPADLGDGLCARVAELEQRIAEALEYAEQWNQEPPSSEWGTGHQAACDALHQTLRGDQ